MAAKKYIELEGLKAFWAKALDAITSTFAKSSDVYSKDAADDKFATKEDAHVRPLLAETYSGLYYGANGTNAGYFMPVHMFPNNDETNNVYYIKLKYTVTSIGYPTYRQVSILELWFGTNGTSIASKVWNSYTGNYLLYYHTHNYPSANLKSNGLHVGFGITSGNNYNKENYARTVTVEVLDHSANVDVSIDAAGELKQDQLMPWRDSSVTWTRTNYTSTSQGLQETGDNDTYTLVQSTSQTLVIGDDLPVGGYNIFGYSRDGKAQAISNYTETYESYTSSVNTARYYNPNGFDTARGLMYNGSSTTYLKGTSPNISAMFTQTSIDLRYSDNCVATNSATTLTIPIRTRVFFRGVIRRDGLFYLAPIKVTYSGKTYKRAWVTEIPTESEFDASGNPVVYWLIGVTYYNSSYASNTYLVNLLIENPVYWFHNGKFTKWDGTYKLEKSLHSKEGRTQKVIVHKAIPLFTAMKDSLYHCSNGNNFVFKVKLTEDTDVIRLAGSSFKNVFLNNGNAQFKYVATCNSHSTILGVCDLHRSAESLELDQELPKDYVVCIKVPVINNNNVIDGNGAIRDNLNAYKECASPNYSINSSGHIVCTSTTGNCKVYRKKYYTKRTNLSHRYVYGVKWQQCLSERERNSVQTYRICFFNTKNKNRIRKSIFFVEGKKGVVKDYLPK